jgi:ribosomal protein S27AE
VASSALGFTDGSCPRCGRSVWNPLVDWRRRVGFSASPIACGNCGLTAWQIGIDGAIAADPVQEDGATVTIAAEDIAFEWIEPADEDVDVKIGVRLRHVPSGIVVEAISYRRRAENERAALQTLALQLMECCRDRGPSAAVKIDDW